MRIEMPGSPRYTICVKQWKTMISGYRRASAFVEKEKAQWLSGLSQWESRKIFENLYKTHMHTARVRRHSSRPPQDMHITDLLKMRKKLNALYTQNIK